MKANIKIDGIGEFKLASVGYGFNQMVDASGRPTSEVLCNQIALSIFPEVANGPDAGEYSNSLFQWMIDGSQSHDGTIEYYTSEKEDQVLKTLAFKGAFCVSFSENMTAISGERITQDILIAVAELDVEGDTYKNMWRKGL